MGDGDRRKLILTEDDLDGPKASADAYPPPSYAQEPPTQAPPSYGAPPQHGAYAPPGGEEFPTVSGVGARPHVIGAGSPTSTPTMPSWLSSNTVLGRSVIAATVGIALGWAATELFGLANWPAGATSDAGVNFRSGVWVAGLGLAFVLVYAGWEQIMARSTDGFLHVARVSAPVGAALGFASGFLAQVVFRELLRSIAESGDFYSYEDARFFLVRAIAWGLFGMGMGAASAALIRSRKKLINGLIGGAIGGAIGGVVFHWLGLHLHSEVFSRLAGLMIVGIGIGLAIGLIETARRDAWLSVVAGGMAGKEFIIYAAETKCGSDPKCDIVLIKDPAIRPYHFIISTPPGAGAQHRTLTAYEGAAVTIQGHPVAQHVLRDGDVIGVGSTQIRYAERAAQQSPTI